MAKKVCYSDEARCVNFINNTHCRIARDHKSCDEDNKQFRDDPQNADFECDYWEPESPAPPFSELKKENVQLNITVPDPQPPKIKIKEQQW